MKLAFGVLVFLLIFSAISEAQVKKIKVACVGNSITYGSGIYNRDRDSYPSVLGQMLGREYDVKNFGLGGRTMLNRGDRPYMKEQIYQEALNDMPDIVLVKLGTNDTKSQNWKYRNEFQKDLKKMVLDFQKLSSNPKIYLCYPAKSYIETGKSINDQNIVNGVIPYINAVSKSLNIPIIDLHSKTSGMSKNFPDRVHPNVQGATVLAETIYEAIKGEKKVHTMQEFPGFKSIWHQCNRYDFNFAGKSAIVVAPKVVAQGRPWIWRPAFFGAFPFVDQALLDKGFHIVYYDLTHNYGSDHSIKMGNRFYNYLVGYYNLSKKVTLEGFSRGGLLAINWAAANTDKIACIYLDAPVCNLESWPSRKREDLWSGMLKEFGISEENFKNEKYSSIYRLESLIKSGIPILSVCGDSDQVVPYEANTLKVREKYVAHCAPINVILKKGVDHHPHSLTNPERILDFILRHQDGYKKQHDINLRGSLQNSYLKFEKEKRGRVAFLGGSITQMDGWRNMVQQELKERFPYTQFEFIEAGIGSTGSTPGAFRLENDVLSKGDIDLLFVEAAVNDHTNGFTAEEQVRGMEGIIRHALEKNAETDIVILHFIYDPFIQMHLEGKTPDVVLNHERVANNYNVSSINLVSEINHRMDTKEFTWKEFGGTHPSWFGHKYYAAAISELFTRSWNSNCLQQDVVNHKIPKALDKYSYSNGRFIDLKTIDLKNGAYIDIKWHPNDKYEKRAGFVDVPMLVLNKPKPEFQFEFTGKAVGLFMVSGPSAGMLEYSVDGGKYKTIDTYTSWSSFLYIPWLFMLEQELEDGKHEIKIKMSKDCNKKSKGTECQIRNVVVN